jgi:hypothetical protein
MGRILNPYIPNDIFVAKDEKLYLKVYNIKL